MRRRPLGRTGLEVSELGFGASPLVAVYGDADVSAGLVRFVGVTGYHRPALAYVSDPAEVRRNVRRLREPLDETLLRDVDGGLAPVRDVGWTSGRPENQCPGGRP